MRHFVCFAVCLSACSGGTEEPPGGSDLDLTSGTITSSGAGGSGTTTGGIGVQSVTVGGIGIGDPPAEYPPGCGDGILADDEVCDDGDLESGDGCSDTCLALESGFSCAVPGEPCIVIARCGDGVVAPSEQCDDANTESGDGCSARCRVELGSKCEGTPSACSP